MQPIRRGYVPCSRRLYVSYVCRSIIQRGAKACPGSRAAAHEIDGFVVSQLTALGSDAGLQAETVAAAKVARTERLPERAQLTTEFCD